MFGFSISSMKNCRTTLTVEIVAIILTEHFSKMINLGTRSHGKTFVTGEVLSGEWNSIPE
jgi:hypothetical protein